MKAKQIKVYKENAVVTEGDIKKIKEGGKGNKRGAHERESRLNIPLNESTESPKKNKK